MEALTKENFWDEMSQKYPKAMAHLLAWIDQYKSEHNWGSLFNPEYSFQHPSSPPKYHELPIAMQFGIFLEWLYSMAEELKLLAVPSTIFRDIPQVIEGWLLKMEVRL